jgi:hypothetical protein
MAELKELTSMINTLMTMIRDQSEKISELTSELDRVKSDVKSMSKWTNDQDTIHITVIGRRLGSVCSQINAKLKAERAKIKSFRIFDCSITFTAVKNTEGSGSKLNSDITYYVKAPSANITESCDNVKNTKYYCCVYENGRPSYLSFNVEEVLLDDDNWYASH